ncbi:hypothetical protein B4U80_12308, partial [Leptotrombidium deliense]
MSFTANLFWKRVSVSSIPTLPGDATLGRRQANVLAAQYMKAKKEELSVAIYKSDIFKMKNKKTTACLSLSHHMWEDQSLRILIGRDDNSVENMLEISGNKNNDWVYSEIELRSNTDQFYVYVVGIMKSRTNGFIAIDDLSVSLEPCPNPEPVQKCTSGELIPPPNVCNFRYDCKSEDDELNCANCTFSTGFCGYKNNGFSRVTVDRQSYIQVFNTFDRIATIESPWLKDSRNSCMLTFDYKKKNCEQQVDCYISVSLLFGSQESVEIWNSDIVNHEEVKWNKVTVAIGAMKHFKVRFTAKFNKIDHNFATTLALEKLFYLNCGFAA